MDLVMLVTRNSICLQGYMGCVIVNPNLDNHNNNNNNNGNNPNPDDDISSRINRSIIGASTNLPLFTHSDSDIHAEIGALGQASQYGNSTKGSTAYITMPPCKRCYAALLMAGVTKIVSQQKYPDVVCTSATKCGIEIVDMGIGYKAQQRTRVETLIHTKQDGENMTEEERKELLVERRKRRKEQKQAKKKAKVERRGCLESVHRDTNKLQQKPSTAATAATRAVVTNMQSVENSKVENSKEPAFSDSTEPYSVYMSWE